MKRLLIPLVAAFVLITGLAVGQTDKREKSGKGWLGVSIKDLTRDVVREYNLKIDDGAYVASVVEDSPADSAGIKKGDVVVEFSGRRIYDADDLSKTVRRTSPGTKTTVVVMRKGDKKTLPVTVGTPRRPESFAIRAPMMRFFQRGRGILGMTVMTLNEQLAEYFGAPNEEGVLIEEVRKESAAGKAGLKAGDVVVKIGSRTVSDVDDIHKALRKLDAGEKVEIQILRKGSSKTVTVEIEEGMGPLGSVAPGHLLRPRVHIAPRWEGDDDLQYEIDVRPEMEELQKEIQRIGPMIERKSRELKDRIQENIRFSIRERVI